MAYQGDWTLTYRIDIAVLFLKTSRYAEVLSSLSAPYDHPGDSSGGDTGNPYDSKAW